jgi:acetoin utilization protein AcuC
MHAINALVPPLLDRFAPDLLLSVHGCDTHMWDPLTHLALTTDALSEQARLVHALAHRHCDGRWVAFGSGGYDWRRVVPRSWAIVWSEMSERPLPSELPPTWLARWHNNDLEPLPRRFRDNPDTVHPVRRDEIESANDDTLKEVMTVAGLR